MPLYDFGCQSCGASFEEFAPSCGPWPVCPKCGGDSAKKFVLTAQTFVPEHMRAANDTGRNREFVQSPETQAKLRSGEYMVAPKGRTPFGDY